MHKIGFIGIGNMGGAIAKGGMAAGYLTDVSVFDLNSTLMEEFKNLGATPCQNGKELAEQCDIIMLCVKPQYLESVVADLGTSLKGKAVVSIALGYGAEKLAPLMPNSRVQFIMPSITCMVGSGTAIVEAGGTLTEEELSFVKGMFNAVGKVEHFSPSLMGVAGTLSGCTPAFAFMFIEALADGAVYHGLPRDKAYQIAATAVMGAAKMALESGTHPGILKDSVCSPGGSTIRGVTALEKGNFRSTVIDAIHGPLTHGK